MAIFLTVVVVCLCLSLSGYWAWAKMDRALLQEEINDWKATTSGYRADLLQAERKRQDYSDDLAAMRQGLAALEGRLMKIRMVAEGREEGEKA